MKRNNAHLVISAWLTLILTAGLQALNPTPSVAAAGPWYVTPGGNDSNTCLSPATACATIHGAMVKPGFVAYDTVRVMSGVYTGAGEYLLLLDNGVNLSGGWNGNFTSQTGFSVLDGENARVVVKINNGVTASMEYFTIVNGFTQDSGRAGGIANDGTLTLSHIKIISNYGNDAGGIYNAGGLTIDNCSINANSGWAAGGIYNIGVLTLNHCEISGNTATYTGGLSNFGSSVVVNNSAFTGNESSNSHGYSGGIHSGFGSIYMNNSTVSYNRSIVSWMGGGIDVSNTNLYIANSTITANHPVGIRGNATINNTILAGNYDDCWGAAINSGGYNLVGATAICQFNVAAGDLVGVDPHLGPLLHFQDQPPYHALLTGSPAINAGNPAGCVDVFGSPVLTDQRGVARLDRCDMGAYEYRSPGTAAIISAFSGTPQRAAPTEHFQSPLQAVVFDNVGTPLPNAMVSFSAPASGPSARFENTGTNTTTAQTGQDGIATSGPLWANAILGSYTVSAASAGPPAPAVFQLSNFIWYVSSSGNDLNSCDTSLQPCATISAVLNKPTFTAGDTIWIASGVYTGAGDEYTAVVTITQPVRMRGGWNETFSAQDGISVIDGQHARPGMQVSADTLVEKFAVMNGKVIQWGGVLTLNTSSVSGVEEFGIQVGGGKLILINSTVRDNADRGIFGSGENIEITLINSTISRNNGGGIFATAGALVSLYNSTITSNRAMKDSDQYGNPTYGGGIYVFSGQVTLKNSILYGNTAKVGLDCVLSEGTSLGHNLIGDLTDCSNLVTDPTDKLGVDPILGELIGRPEYPAYHPLLPGSPAINGGDPAGCTDPYEQPLLQDQRGAPRTGACDIGAYEYHPAGSPAKIFTAGGSNQRTPPSYHFRQPLKALVVDALGTPVSNLPVTFTAPSSGPSATFSASGTRIMLVSTNASGLATSSRLMTNLLSGSYTVSASAPGPLVPAEFALTNIGWYVSPEGNDANPCQSPVSTCRTIAGVLGKVGFWDGDPILLPVGIFDSGNSLLISIDKDATILGGWNATFSSQDGVTTIDCGNTNTIGVSVPGQVDAYMERFSIHNCPNSLHNLGTMRVNQCTISGNHADDYSLLVYNGPDGSLTMDNCTISGNDDSSGSVLHNFYASLYLNNVTISNNRAGWGGAIYNEGGKVELSNTLVAENTGEFPDCFGSITANYSLIGSSHGCNIEEGIGNIIDQPAQIGFLIDRPGRQAYHPLLPGSPAINGGNPAGCTDQHGEPLLEDQRGLARSGACDIGAYEYYPAGSPAEIYAYSGGLQRSAPLTPFLNPLKAVVIDARGGPVGDEVVTFTAPGAGPSAVFALSGTNTTTVPTLVSGLATVSAFRANQLNGSYTVNATAPATPGSAAFALTNIGWYVSPSGSDANTCQSPAAACRSVFGVLVKGGFQEDDSILLKDGKYTNTTTPVINLNKNARLFGGWDETFSTHDGLSTVDCENTDKVGVYIQSEVDASLDRFSIQNCRQEGLKNFGKLRVNQCEIINNRGISSGPVASFGFLSLTNCTISGNTGSVGNVGTLHLNNVTISDGGGLINSDAWGAVAELRNTLIFSTNIWGGPSCTGSIVANYSVIGNSTGCTITSGTGNIIDKPIPIFPLMYRFSRLGYHPVAYFSQTIDAGDPEGCTDQDGNPIPADIRGIPRGGRCDIGSFEFDPLIDLFTYLFLPIITR